MGRESVSSPLGFFTYCLLTEMVLFRVSRSLQGSAVISPFRKQYVKNPNGELTLSRPKTETSVRKVSIPQEAVDLLIAEQGKHPENPYMFPSPATGEMYYPNRDPHNEMRRKI